MKVSLSLFLGVALSLSWVQPGSGFVSTFSKSTTFEATPSRWTRLQESTENAATDDKSFAPPFSDKKKKKDLKAIILDPFLEAVNPKYMAQGPVGEGEFLISRMGDPTLEELATENLYKIINREASDLEVNTLVWKCLGYRFDNALEEWTTEQVFPKWKERYPTPPDMIGMQRIYSKDVDGPCLRNNQALVRSIPVDNKKSYLKEYMLQFGFTGYQVAVLTPNLTRRAQCTNWLLFYRDELFGYTVGELRERRRLKQEKEEQERLERLKEGVEEKDEFKPPVKEVF